MFNFIVFVNYFWKLFKLFKCNIFRNKSAIFLILIVNIFYIHLTSSTIFSNSLHQCQKLCQEKNLAFPLPHGSLGWTNISQSNCDFDCLIDACRLGCKDLDSHDSNCNARCDPIAGATACNQGCRAVTDIFLHKIQILIDLSSVEIFLDKSLGFGMKWSFPETQSNLLKEISTTNIQWISQIRPGGKQGWRWTKLNENAFKDDSLTSTVYVAFESYYIDVELRLAVNWRDNIIVSSKHFRLSTIPEKQLLPSYSTQPSSGIYLQLSHSSFVACWNSESSNKFKINLFTTKENKSENLVYSEIVAAKCHVFRNVTINEGKELRLAITDLGSVLENIDEEESSKKKTLEIKNEDNNLISEKALQINISMEMIEEPKKSHPLLLFSDGSSLFLLHDLNDFILLNEPIKVLFALNSSQSITALCAFSQTEVLIGLSDGAIFHLEILFEFGIELSQLNRTMEGELKTQIRKLREADGVSISQIVVDFIQEYFYAVRDKISIVRCKISSCDNTTTTMTLTIAPNFLQRLDCDTLNGFLYYVTNVGDIFSMSLFPIDAPKNSSQTITRRISELPAANTIEVDISEQKLFIVTKSGHLMSRDLVDTTIKDEREIWTLNDRYRNVIRSQFYQNRLYWISTSCGDSHPWESCLFSEEFEYQYKTIHLNKYLFTGPIREFTLLKPFSTPQFLLPPSKVGLIVVDMEAFISWKPPTFLPFQASGSSWRSLTYEYILQSERDDTINNLNINSMSDLDNSTEINNKIDNNITETLTQIFARGYTQKTYSSNIQLENNIPNINYYIAKVRVCIANNNKICSEQISAKSRPLQITEANKQISLLNKRVSDLSSQHSVNQFGQFLSNINAMDWQGREIAEEQRIFYPQIPSELGISIAYDNTANVLLSSSRKDASITQRFDSNNIRFLDSAFVNQIALLPSKAVVLLATAYSVNVYRTTATFDRIIYNCAVGGEECGEVIGIAFDDKTNEEEGQKILLLVQLSSGTVQLLQSQGDFQPFQLIHSVPNGLPYRIRQLSGFVDGRFLILTEDGYFGTLDSSDLTVNLNFAIRDINHLIVTDSISPFERRFLHFDGPIHFDEKTAQLRWSVIKGGGGEVSTDTNELIPLLFKLSLFRDGFSGNEPTLIISQENSFSLPPKLLQAWNSRQRFDAQVEAINPWLHTWANQTGLNAATKPPSAPEDVRIYATQQRTVDGSRAIIDLFWHEPSEWNGEKLGYQLNCTITQGTTTSTSSSSSSSTIPNDLINSNTFTPQYMNTTLKSSQRSFSFTVRSGKVGCLVFAINDQQVGQPSLLAEIDGSEFKPLIRLFAIDSTESLVAIQNWTIELSKTGSSISKLRHSAKNRRRQTIQIGQQQNPQQQQMIHSSQYQTITFIGNDLYAIRKETEILSSSSPSSQLFLVKLDINQVDQVIYKASLIGDSVQQQIDAMASDWVANRLLLVGNRALMQIQLDQLQQDSATTISPKRLFQLSMGAQDAKQLIFDPFTNTALLLTKNGSLLALNLNNGSETNLELTTGCLKQKTITSIVGEFIWNRPASPQLYALTWNGLIELKIGSDNCPEVNVNWDMFGERGLKAISLFAVADKVFVFATPSDLLVYDRLSASVSQFPIPNPPLRQLLTVSQSSQPFPDRNCFKLPSISSVDFIVKNDGRTGAIVELPETKRGENNEVDKQPIECQNISQPQTQYEIHFRKRGAEKEKIIRTTNNKTLIDQGVLDKNTDYDISIGWSNRFWSVQGHSESKPFHTGFGFPSAPRDPVAFSLSPDTVLLNWLPPELLNAPASEIRYRISQQSSSLISPVPIAVRPQQGDLRNHFSTPTAEVISCDDANICQAKVPNLRPSTDYHFWILALHVSRISLNTLEDSEATSVETQAHTREIPGTLRLENATSTSLNLHWNALPSSGIGFPSVQNIQISIQYRQSGVDVSWTLLYNSTFSLESNTSTVSQHSFCIDELRPATTYDYRYVAEYNIIIPNDDSDNKEKNIINELFFQQVQQARTKAGTPSAPTNVQLFNDPKGTWTLKWSAPDSDGGETIQNYAVEYRPNSQSEWEIADRGLPPDRLFWRVTWSESNARHGSEFSDAELTEGQFRVRAANSEGFGDFGYTTVKGADNINSLERNGKSMLWNVLLVLLIVVLLLCAGAYYILRTKMSKKRKVREKLHKPICMETIGEQIQQFHQTQMQFSPEVQNELKILPKILPSRLKITKQLGIGSFGRVCEGFMRLDRDISVRVAVKYLKDNNAENRVKFLKEAILMNNFDHPNIVKLVGVNIEQGEHFLVLELMDGGDLLSFLRECRPKKGRSSRLCLRDLIAIAVDIGRGCVHLETYKHVHRDLAARNCLISSKTSPQRVTKIADFGLARSLFVDDYYRVHGQDMLPLRWLSPEVITQGLFTSKSDVWAFGVLLWEIITLGEQPYTNRQNTEVLNLLSNGICLERPLECPEELYQIMKSCWTVPSEQRPKFLEIQPKMELIRGLNHFQSRDPFPSGILNGFENSLDSSTSTHESSTTTTNGGDSIAAHFEKSENSSSRKHSRFVTKPARGQQQNTTNSTVSTTITTAPLNDSDDYEIPIRPFTNVLQSSLYNCNPFSTSQFRKVGNTQPPSVIAFQNNAFMVDEEISEKLPEQQFRNSQNHRNLPMLNNLNNSRNDESENQIKLSSSSKVSRV